MRRSLLLVCVLCLVPQAQAADKLIDFLKKNKFEGMVGTWVDADTKGKVHKTTITWKIKDRVLETVSEQGGNKSVGLIAVDSKKSTIFTVGADSKGTTWLGDMKFKNGDAVQGVLFSTEDGKGGAMSITYHFENKDALTMTINIVGLGPIKMKLVRAE